METAGQRLFSGVPMVKVLDQDGKEVLRGWYFRHERRQVCPIGDDVSEEDVDEGVVYDEFTDFNMPKKLMFARVTPPHRIEVL